MKHKPWGIQKKAKASPRIEPDDIISIAERIERPDVQALFLILYVTGARITEIVKCPHLFKTSFKKEEGEYKITNQEKLPWDYKGILKNNIKTQEINGRPVMTFDIQNRKNPHMPRKTIPVLLDIPFEAKVAGMISSYLETLEYDDPLFKFGRSRAEQLITKETGFNCHFIRDIRATHMAHLYRYTEQELKLHFGWHTGNMATRYVQSRWQDLIKPKDEK